MTTAQTGRVLRHGLRVNAGQFTLLVAVNALVGATLGQERTVLPLLATSTFGLSGYAVATTYIAAFGVTKAVTNLAAGSLADRYGRKPVLLAGWLIGLPVPLLLIVAPTWAWVVAANVLLGVNQGLTWSTTVIMKIDLAGPARRGLAMGLNEAAGYLAVAGSALATGWLAAAYGLRPAPFLAGLAVVALGFGLSGAAVRETRDFARQEAAATPGDQVASSGAVPMSMRQVLQTTTWRDPTLSSVSQAGLVNNLNDGLAWGLFPLLFTAGGLDLRQVGMLAAMYPGVWGVTQLVTGPASDRLGRKGLIVAGMWLQAAALVAVAVVASFGAWAAAAVLLGLGTAMVYPTLLAAIGDVAHPSWRARSIGVYRLWRDAGFAVGALLSGVVADLAGLRAAVLAVAALTAASGAVVAVRMPGAHRFDGARGPGSRRGRHPLIPPRRPTRRRSAGRSSG